MAFSAFKNIELLKQQFSQSLPFKHLCIDGFLEQDFAERLLQQFPKFDPERAKNEHGRIGGKATREDVRSLGPAYQAYDDLCSSADFLRQLSTITGIPNLLYDPEYFGGGTHENRHGQELDVHIDFNYHRSTGYHRRLNLIVYLNHDWQSEWGGGIELHSNPRNKSQNKIIEFAPIFNRCVIFETNEISWHGFSQINLPESMRHLSRKSMTVYFYTKERSADEIVPPHSTFYVQRPLPSTIKAGATLSGEDLQNIKALIEKRDVWIEYYQNLELRLSGEITNLKQHLTNIQTQIAPRTYGYFSSIETVQGYHVDGWIGPSFFARYQTQRKLNELSIKMFLSEHLLEGTKMQIRIGTLVEIEVALAPGKMTTITIPCEIAADAAWTLEMKSTNSFCPKQLGINSDDRKLVCLLDSITATHG